MPWPKMFKGIKFQGLGQKEEKINSQIPVWSLVETGVCCNSSSLLEVISLILISPSGRLLVIRSFTHNQCGGLGVGAKAAKGDSGLETLDAGSSISGSVNCEFKLSPYLIMFKQVQ